MAKKKPWDIVGDAVGGAGSSASNAGGGGGRGGGAVGSASGGVASVSGGVGTATGTSTGYSSVGAGVSSVASGVGTATGTKPSAPTPVAAPYTSRSTTTVNLKPLIGTISDPATRALASSAISNGLKYEVNPSVLLAAASVTDYGRKGQGKGYTNLGDGSEDGPKSIRQAAKYLSEAGFHSDPDGAIKALAKTIGHDPSEIRKTASGYTELDQAARKVEEAPGDTHVKGVGRFKYRKPEDRPSSKVARAARDAAAGVATAGVAADRTTGGWGSDDAIAVANGRKPLAANELQAAQGAAALGKTAVAAQGILPGAKPQGPNPRKVANRLEKAANKTGSMQQYSDLGPDAPELAAAAVKYGKQYGIPPSVLFNQLGIESGWGADITGPPTPYGPAQGWAQFIKSTRDQVLEESGIDAWKSPTDAVHAQAYLLNQSGYKDDPRAAVFSYNHSDAYVSDVLDGAAQYKELDSAQVANVPKQLVQRANKVLGEKATKAILAGGKLIKDPHAGEKTKVNPQKAKWAGAPDAIRAIVPKEFWGAMRGDKRTPTENESVGGAADSDHLTTNTQSFAGDFSIGTDITEEQAWQIAEAAAKALGVPSTGTQSVEKDGYRYQLIWQDEGHYDHVHIGAELIDPSSAKQVLAVDPNIPIPGTKLAVKPPSSAGGSASSTSSTSGAVATELSGALDAAGAGSGSGSRATRAAAAPGMTIQSAAAAYARRSLQGGDTQDPLYDAFRPSR